MKLHQIFNFLREVVSDEELLKRTKSGEKRMLRMHFCMFIQIWYLKFFTCFAHTRISMASCDANQQMNTQSIFDRSACVNDERERNKAQQQSIIEDSLLVKECRCKKRAKT